MCDDAPERPLYCEGDALRSARRQRQEFDSIDEEGYIEVLSQHQPLGEEDNYEVGEDYGEVEILRLWQVNLLRNARTLDGDLDGLVSDVMEYGDTWRDPKHPIQDALRKLRKRNRSLRNLESDVEDFVMALTSQPAIRDGMAQPPVTVLREVQSTYQRAYDLCLMKLNGISSGRVTAANITLSVVAILIALASVCVSIQSLPH